jgi:pimeloyl-ACP methyl ester carboxylesterase
VSALASAVFTTPDGAEIAYRVRPGRDTFILLHALGCDASLWTGFVAALPPDVGLLIPEMRGHGGSTLGWRAPSVELWADDVVRLVRQKAIERPAIVGISMGGYVALSIAAAQPSLARGYGFVSTTAAPDDEAGKQRRAASIAQVRRDGWRAYLDEQMPRFLNETRLHAAERKDHLTRMFARAGDTGLPPTLMALAARPDRRPLLMSIGVPAVAIVGSLDEITPPDRARAIATAIRGARLHVLDDTAHLSVLESPSKVAGLVGTL